MGRVLTEQRPEGEHQRPSGTREGAAGAQNGAPAAQRVGDEFEFTDGDFRTIADLIRRHAGISLSDAKRNLVYGRLVRRLRSRGISRFSDYCALLERDGGDEMEHFVNSLTTNLTSFLREPHHFEFLQHEWLPTAIRTGRTALRAWSAGCSTGEEPYSIAMTLAEELPDGIEARILATDLDSSAVATGEAGVYPAERVAGLSRQRIRRWFQRGVGENEGLVRVRGRLREMITFRKLNLIDDWPMRSSFDFIFCRNVVIYFDKSVQRILFDRMADYLVPGGYLFIGHSESLYKVTDRFEPLGNTVYRRVR